MDYLIEEYDKRFSPQKRSIFSKILLLRRFVWFCVVIPVIEPYSLCASYSPSEPLTLYRSVSISMSPNISVSVGIQDLSVAVYFTLYTLPFYPVAWFPSEVSLSASISSGSVSLLFSFENIPTLRQEPFLMYLSVHIFLWLICWAFLSFFGKAYDCLKQPNIQQAEFSSFRVFFSIFVCVCLHLFTSDRTLVYIDNSLG